MKIDTHVHILPENLPSFQEKFGYPGWVHMEHSNEYDSNGFRKSKMVLDDGRLFRKVDERVYSPTAIIKAMEKTGISKQILSTVPVTFNYWAKAEHAEYVSRYLNDNIANVVREWPEKFIGMGTVPMQNVDLAIKELIRCKYELKMKAIIIGTHVNDVPYYDPKFEPFWKAAEENDVPLFIHPWDVADGNGRWSKFWLKYIVGMTAETTAAALSLAYSGVLERHPRLRIMLSHSGGALPYLSGRANHAFKVYPEDMQQRVTRPPDDYLKRKSNVCGDTLFYRAEALDLVLDYFGEDSLLLGSDFPFLLGEHFPGSVIEKSDASVDIQEKIFNQNAIRFFNL